MGLFVWGETSKKQSAKSASLSLYPSNQELTFSKGKTYQVEIKIDSQGKEIDGTDVIINFDPKKAEVTRKEVKTANIFENYILNNVDNKKGQINLSALTFNAKAVSGTLGSFEFRPNSIGVVNFTFDFTSGRTTDSNIAEHSTKSDILGKVDNATFIFK